MDFCLMFVVSRIFKWDFVVVFFMDCNIGYVVISIIR